MKQIDRIMYAINEVRKHMHKLFGRTPKKHDYTCSDYVPNENAVTLAKALTNISVIINGGDTDEQDEQK